ncbi:MAG TPA: TMEM175 family protein [Ktedonobacterales bacterium]|nr:TMEM175 family protein [Ktedonobacterales bacterium]
MVRYPSESGEERRETGRLEALSDGVFAIALTLLVLSVPVPSRDELLMSGAAVIFGQYHWLSMLTYVISFLTILVMWVNHHSVFQYIARIDRPFIYLNGALLMLIVFVNYPTALVADAMNTPAATLATATYSATFVITAILYNALWLWASTGRRLLARDADPAGVARITYQYRFGPFVYLAAFGLAFLSPWLSVALNGALGVYFVFTGQITRSRAKEGIEREPAEPQD